MKREKISCWVLSEGMAGTENQCIAVAEALGVDYDVKRITLKQPWKMLSPYLGFEQGWSFSPTLSSPWPDLLIASGRKSIAASRYIKRKSGGKTFTVQIQDPRVSPDQFDLVAVPHHDPTRGENVVVTDASPNRITQQKLAEEQKEFSDFEKFKQPRVAVLIGGRSKAYRMVEGHMRKIGEDLLRLNASLMITTSRRTGERNELALRKTLGAQNAIEKEKAGYSIFFHNGHRPNPYMAMLAAADYILVTADSASMISDACSTGKPVYMIPLQGGHPRIDKLHKHLIDKGVLRVFDGDLEPYTYDPLHDADKIADAIKQKMGT